MEKMRGVESLVKLLTESSGVPIQEDVWVPSVMQHGKPNEAPAGSLFDVIVSARQAWVQGVLDVVGRRCKLTSSDGGDGPIRVPRDLGWMWVSGLFDRPGIQNGSFDLTVFAMGDAGPMVAMPYSGDERVKIGYASVAYRTQDGTNVSKTFNFDAKTTPQELGEAIVAFIP